jgi:hypothetical protein
VKVSSTHSRKRRTIMSSIENGWRDDWENAPRDGTEIEFGYIEGDGELSVSIAMWSDRPVCMLGSRNGGHKPGWAVGYSEDTDTNLPVDQAEFWREFSGVDSEGLGD